ncbi:MAG: phosphoadenosine phosphosulfate reductase family protein [Chitinophagaceae bacterium]|nr:phosphoadenosine phosphosulfate reductase family protein [Chitinophagaceae bacterium]
MTNKVRHVLGISGGKDSAALAIYLRDKYPELDIEYYTCDTGKELSETYELIDKLESYLGKKITRLMAADQSSQDPFDHFYHIYGGYLPSSNARWCTKKLKLEPFETFVGNDPVVSYVGIRGDEEREGYISKKSNIQSIFPFRKNIWSEDVISKALKNENIKSLSEIYKFQEGDKASRALEIIEQPISSKFTIQQKLNLLLDNDTKAFNAVIFEYLNTSSYPLANEQSFPLIENDEILVREDIFKILRESGVGVPEYYEKIEFEVEGKIGEYARSRSGCYFCFFQQKIEWVWLYEQHPDLFEKAIQYENAKDGFTWNQNESLEELKQPDRIATIKKEYVNRKKIATKTGLLSDSLLDDAEEEGCAACFI